MTPSFVRTVVVGTVLAVGAACGGDGGSNPGPTPTQIAKDAGDNQVSAAGSPLDPLSVIVRDAANAPVGGVTVNWAVGTGGGSVSAPTSVTDAGGIASITRTLGPNAGNQTTTATRTGLTGSPLTFSAVAQIQGATQMALNAGNNQTDTVLATLATPLSVLVLDQNNAPVLGGVVVTWSAPNDTLSSATSTTNASGIASVTLKHGPATGTRAATATVTGLQGSPVSFTHTATAGAAVSMALNGGDAQTGAVNTALPTPHSIIVRDSYNNPVPGVTVTWVLGDGGGSISSTAPVTAANGVAGVTRTLGGSLGTHTDTASVASLSGSPVVFTATAALANAAVTIGSGGNFFNPSALTVPNGTKVIWTAATGVHAIEWTGGPATPPNSGNPIPATQTYEFTFTVNGTYNYVCPNHIGMAGTVTVN